MKNFVTLVALLLTIQVSAQPIAQFRGPNRDGHYPEKGLLKKWPENGPKLLTRIDGIGKGYSQPVVCDGVIYTTGIKHDSLDVIGAYDLSGKLIWETSYGHAWPNSYPDTRCTPTIKNGKIYLISGVGTVSCLNAADGKEIWKQKPHDDFKGEWSSWGIAESVLLTKDAVLYVTGGSMTSVVAYDQKTGALKWKTESLGGPRAYASSQLIVHNGQEMILAQTANDALGIDPATGKILWRFDLQPYQPGKMGKGANTNMPIYLGGDVLIVSGYDHPALMLTLAPDGRSVTLKWQNNDLDTHHGGVVLQQGTIFGTNWLNNGKGQWVSVDWKTGKTNWVTDWNNKGSIVEADGLLYCYEEKAGNVALVEPSAQEFKIISTFKVADGEGPFWAHPAIYDGKLYLRHGNVLLIYSIKA